CALPIYAVADDTDEQRNGDQRQRDDSAVGHPKKESMLGNYRLGATLERWKQFLHLDLTQCIGRLRDGTLRPAATFQGSAIPFSEIGRGGIGGLQELKQRVIGRL